MDSREVLQEARSGELRPVYLIVGEEQFLARDAISALKTATLTGGVEGLNDDVFEAMETTVGQVLNVARTLPMMAPRRFVLLRHVDRWDKEGKDSKKQSSLDTLLDYAQAPSNTSVLVITAAKLDKRRRLYTGAKKQGFLVTCDALTNSELPRWIRNQAESLGHRIDAGVAELLAELTGPELSQVSDALERLSLYVGPDQPITEEAAAECVVRVRPTTVWELVGAVGERDTGRALAALEQVFEAQDRGLRLLGLLAWQTRQLLKFESAVRAGKSAPDAAKAAGAPPFKARDLMRQVKKLPRRELESWLPALAKLDLALKGGSQRPAKAILEHGIIELCRG